MNLGTLSKNKNDVLTLPNKRIFLLKKVALNIEISNRACAHQVQVSEKQNSSLRSQYQVPIKSLIPVRNRTPTRAIITSQLQPLLNPVNVLDLNPTPNTNTLLANSVYESKTAAQLQQYVRCIMGALPVKTYTNTIKEGWLSSFAMP